MTATAAAAAVLDGALPRFCSRPGVYLRRRASRSHSSRQRMSPSRTGPLTLRMMERVGSSKNSTRTCPKENAMQVQREVSLTFKVQSEIVFFQSGAVSTGGRKTACMAVQSIAWRWYGIFHERVCTQIEGCVMTAYGFPSTIPTGGNSGRVALDTTTDHTPARQLHIQKYTCEILQFVCKYTHFSFFPTRPHQ